MNKLFKNLENKAIGIMKPGQVFTIEPMINEGKISFTFASLFKLISL